MFIVKNEWQLDVGPNGGIQAYITPNDYDMCPEPSAYYPINAQVKAMIHNEEWIVIVGEMEMPDDIRERQALAYAHAIPYWQEYQQRLQYARDVEEASRVQAQQAILDDPSAGHAFVTPIQSSARGLDAIAGTATPTICGPAGLPPLTDAAGMPVRHHIGTPQHSLERTQMFEIPRRTRSTKPMGWRRSLSCTSGRQRSITSCMTNPESVDRADFTSAEARQSRFTFGGDKQRPVSEMPKLPLDGLNGYVMVQGQSASSGRRKGMTPRDAQLNQQTAILMKESQNLQGCYKELLKEKGAWQLSQLQPSAPPGPSQMRYWESQDKKIEEIKEMMTNITHEFKHVGAKLRNVEGSVIQLATKTTEIETAMETWTEENALEPCEEDPYEEEGEEE